MTTAKKMKEIGLALQTVRGAAIKPSTYVFPKMKRRCRHLCLKMVDDDSPDGKENWMIGYRECRNCGVILSVTYRSL